MKLGLSAEASERGGNSEGLSSLLSGLSENYSDKDEGALKEGSEKAQETIQNVSTPASHASTLSKTLTEGRGAEKTLGAATKLGAAQEDAEAALKTADHVSDGLGKVGETGGLVATPLSVANSSNTLLRSDSSKEDKINAGSTLAADATSAAKLVGGATLDDGLSSIGKVASVQKGLAAKAPAAAGVLGKVGKAAPVVGGIASGVSGAIEIKNAFKGEEVDKAKLVSGSLGVAAGVAMFIPGGQPVAAALGVTSLVIDNRETIARGAKAVGGGVAKGAKAVGGGVADGAKAAGDVASKGAQVLSNGASEGAKVVGKTASKAADGAKKLVGKFL